MAVGDVAPHPVGTGSAESSRGLGGGTGTGTRAPARLRDGCWGPGGCRRAWQGQ